MTVPYTFANQTGPIPLAELDANFAAVPNYANTAGTVTQNAQTNITTVGTLTSITSIGLVSTTGNITGNYIIGNGSQLTGLSPSYGNANVAAYLPIYTGNIAGNNIGVSGAINAVGEITSFANLVTTGEVQSTGNILGANFKTSGVVSASGNITAANFLGNVAATTVSASGNITTAGYFVGIFAGSISGNVTAPGTNTQVIYNNSGNLAGSTGFTFNQSSNALVITGNVTGSNILTAGLVSATSTITGGNILTAGIISAAGNIRGANINTNGLITAVGNITSFGNISGTYILGNGSQLTGVATTITRTTVTVASGSLAANAAANIIATGYQGYALYSINANNAAWVTLYTSNAAATSDYARTIVTDPTPGSGVIAESVTNASAITNFTPAVIGFNNETIPTVAIPMKIVNNGNTTANISVTLTLLKMEG
jgi:hypothetical protein